METVSPIFGWAVLALIAVGLVFRNRRSVKAFFRSDKEPRILESNAPPPER